MRLDKFLAEQGLARSRTHAQQLIREGLVLVRGILARDPADPIDSSFTIEDIRVEAGESNRYVSRGGLKLEGALKRINLNVKGFAVFDVGISTGGFTDCILKSGAARVVGIDVGHDQLAQEIKNDPRVESHEGVNVKNLPQFLTQHAFENKFDLVVVDISFISIEHVMMHLPKVLKPGGHALVLIKPQFEVGRLALDKNGIVKDPKLIEDVCAHAKTSAEDAELRNIQMFPSDLTGGDGNREMFLHATIA